MAPRGAAAMAITAAFCHSVRTRATFLAEEAKAVLQQFDGRLPKDARCHFEMTTRTSIRDTGKTFLRDYRGRGCRFLMSDLLAVGNVAEPQNRLHRACWC